MLFQSLSSIAPEILKQTEQSGYHSIGKDMTDVLNKM